LYLFFFFHSQGTAKIWLKILYAFIAKLRFGDQFRQDLQEMASELQKLGIHWLTFRNNRFTRIDINGTGMTGSECKTVGRLLKLLFAVTRFYTANGTPAETDFTQWNLTRFKGESVHWIRDFVLSRGKEIVTKVQGQKDKNIPRPLLNVMAVELREVAIVTPTMTVQEVAVTAVSGHALFCAQHAPVHVVGDGQFKKVVQEAAAALYSLDEASYPSGRPDGKQNAFFSHSLCCGTLALPEQNEHVGSQQNVDDGGGEAMIPGCKRVIKQTHGVGGPKASMRRMSLLRTLHHLHIVEPEKFDEFMESATEDEAKNNMEEDMAAAGMKMPTVEEAEEHRRYLRQSKIKEVNTYADREDVLEKIASGMVLDVWHENENMFVEVRGGTVRSFYIYFKHTCVKTDFSPCFFLSSFFFLLSSFFFLLSSFFFFFLYIFIIVLQDQCC